MLNPESMDLTQIAEAIRVRKFSSLEITQWSLNRLKTTGEKFNAVLRLYEETAIDRAKNLDEKLSKGELVGPLHGVPLAHKDLIGIKGQELNAGSLIRRGFIADETAWVMQCLDQDGQVNLGSLHMAELALSPTGFNIHYPQPCNPWNEDYVSGGSSSGSGIAVAARLVFGSIGSDSGGSIRHPSAMCGITGLKPTQGLISARGVYPLSKSLDCVGPMAQSARDCALILDTIVKFDEKDPLSVARPLSMKSNYSEILRTSKNHALKGIKIGIPQEYYREDIDREIAKALETSLEVLKGLGAKLEPTKVPDMPRLNAMMQKIMSSEAAFLHQVALKETPELIAEQVRLRVEPGLSWSAIEYIEATEKRISLRDEFIRIAFNGCDLIHIPTLVVQTPTIEYSTTGTAAEVLVKVARLTHATRAINYLGLPAMSVPVGFTSAGLPIGMQLVGRPFDEITLLNVSDKYQGEVDWHSHLPSYH